MLIKSKHIAPAILSLLTIMCITLACAGEKDAAPKSFKPVETYQYEDGTDDAGGSLKTPNTGILDSPQMPFQVDTPYVYELTQGGEPTGRAEISVSNVGETDFKFVCNQTVYGPGDSEEIAEVMTVCALDKNLRHKMYIRRLSEPDGSTKEIKSVYFYPDTLTIETKPGPIKEDSTVVEIKRPYDDTWLSDFMNILSSVIIIACVDPAADEIGVWVLDINSERLGRFSLRSKGDEPFTLNDGLTTLRVSKYEGNLDGIVLGTYFVSPDGRLIAMDKAGDFNAELQMLSEEVDIAR